MAFSAQQRDGMVAEMNITPLVDVMLVLLIIFMVAVPMLSKTMTLDFGPSESDASPDLITMQVETDGNVMWDGVRMPAFAIDAAMRAEAVRDEPPIIRVEAADDAPYDAVMQAMVRARNAGLERIALN